MDRRGVTIEVPDAALGKETTMLYDRTKRRDPTPKEQANWDRLFAVEKENRRKEREKMRFSNASAQRSMLDRFRSP
jgi:hypothetical protein